MTPNTSSSKEPNPKSVTSFNDFRQSIVEMVNKVLKVNLNNVNIELMSNKQLSEVADFLGDATVHISNLYDNLMQEQNDREWDNRGIEKEKTEQEVRGM